MYGLHINNMTYPSKPQQEERLATLETRVQHIDETVRNIQLQVTNHIPSEIKEVRTELHEFKLQQSKLFVEILVTTIATLIGVVISLVI